jgi:hypothetical protein
MMNRDDVEKLVAKAQNAVWNGYEEADQVREETVDKLVAMDSLASFLDRLAELVAKAQDNG